MGLWVLGLAVANINESQRQTYESKPLFLMTSLQYYCIPGLAEIKTYAQKMQDAQVTKSLSEDKFCHSDIIFYTCCREVKLPCSDLEEIVEDSIVFKYQGNVVFCCF